MRNSKLYHKTEIKNGKLTDSKELMNDFLYLNESGDLVKSNKEIREYFSWGSPAIFVGGYPFSYICLCSDEFDALEIVQEHHGELNRGEDSDYWYSDPENPENSYNTFMDNFCVCEPITGKKLIEKLREIN